MRPSCLAFAIAFVLTVTPAAQVATPDADLPVASDEIQQFVRAALEDRITARNIPDFGLIKSETRLLIREELSVTRQRLDRRALPQRPDGLQFSLISSSAVQ